VHTIQYIMLVEVVSGYEVEYRQVRVSVSSAVVQRKNSGDIVQVLLDMCSFGVVVSFCTNLGQCAHSVMFLRPRALVSARIAGFKGVGSFTNCCVLYRWQLHVLSRSIIFAPTYIPTFWMQARGARKNQEAKQNGTDCLLILQDWKGHDYTR